MGMNAVRVAAVQMACTTDAEANVPVAPSPVTDTEFDEMVRSCVRNDAMEKVKAKRAALAKRLQVQSDWSWCGAEWSRLVWFGVVGLVLKVLRRMFSRDVWFVFFSRSPPRRVDLQQ